MALFYLWGNLCYLSFCDFRKKSYVKQNVWYVSTNQTKIRNVCRDLSIILPHAIQSDNKFYNVMEAINGCVNLCNHSWLRQSRFVGAYLICLNSYSVVYTIINYIPNYKKEDWRSPKWLKFKTTEVKFLINFII